MSSDHFEKPEKPLSVLVRKGNYRKTCRTAGQGFNSFGKYSQVHHIVCEHAVAQWKDHYEDNPAKMQYIEDCLWITDWNINHKDNLIGLPTNVQFIDIFGNLPETAWIPLDLPSHLVDHNTDDGYTEEVGAYLKTNIWDTLEESKKNHEVDAEAIKTQLKNASGHFEKRLRDRAKREGGVKKGWKLRFEKKYEKKWYHPFSMAETPKHRYPGVSHTDLTDIFMKLG